MCVGATYINDDNILLLLLPCVCTLTKEQTKESVFEFQCFQRRRHDRAGERYHQVQSANQESHFGKFQKN